MKKVTKDVGTTEDAVPTRGRVRRSGLLSVIACAGALLGSVLPGRAHAIEPQLVSFGVGALGVVGGQFLDEPPDSDVFYPGFAGLGAGGGLMLEARFVGFVGVEIDVLRTGDHGSGTATINNVDIDLTLGQGAWHVPVLAKLVLPSPVVAPYVIFGPQFVFPSEPTTEVRSAAPVPAQRATADNYVMLTGGLGMEIKLPLPTLDLRIPVSLRGSYNPGVGNSLAERREGTQPVFTYRTEWKYAIALAAGVAAYF
jgi:hypothetical protein